jgi:ABC-type transport system involved in multi-copper enzyme maturation permease subunit
MSAALYAVLGYYAATETEMARRAWEAPATDPALLKAIALIFLELMLVTAIALFFSSFSSPILSAVLTFGLYIVGHFNADLKNFERVVESPAAGWFARALYYLLPNLAPFDIKADVVHARPVATGYMAWTAGYAALYIALLLIAAMVIFSRRDFK